MIRKIQTLLIRLIAAGRPVMINVHMNGEYIKILGDKADVRNCHFYWSNDLVPPMNSVLNYVFVEPPQ